MKITRIPTKEEIKKAKLRKVLDTIELICRGVAIGFILLAVLFAVRGVSFHIGGEEFFNPWTVRSIVLFVISLFFWMM